MRRRGHERCGRTVAVLLGCVLAVGCASGGESSARDAGTSESADADDGLVADASDAGGADAGDAIAADAGGDAGADAAVAPGCGEPCVAGGLPCPPDQACEATSGRCGCRTACAADDDCAPGRRCLAGPCGCTTCVDYVVPLPMDCPDGFDTALLPPPDDRPVGGHVCVPPLCGAGACYNDHDCGEGSRCAGEDVATARQGTCAPAVAAPTCFDDDDCPGGAPCAGATVCAACGTCARVPAAGTCAPEPGAATVSLHVREDEWGWLPPGPITAHWVNLGPTPVALPTCDAVVVESAGWGEDPWTAVDGAFPPCEGGDAEPPAVALAPGATHPVEGLTIPCYAGPDCAVRVRLRGRYARGCPSDEPFDPPRCAEGPLAVTSETFFVAIPY